MYEIGSARRVSGHRASRRVCRVSFVWSQSQAGTRNRRRLARVEQPARRDRTQVVQAKHGHCPPIPRRVVPVPRPASLPLACQVIDSGVVWPMRTESSPPGRGCLGCGIGGNFPCFKTDKFCSLHVGWTAGAAGAALVGAAAPHREAVGTAGPAGAGPRWRRDWS